MPSRSCNITHPPQQRSSYVVPRRPSLDALPIRITSHAHQPCNPPRSKIPQEEPPSPPIFAHPHDTASTTDSAPHSACSHTTYAVREVSTDPSFSTSGGTRHNLFPQTPQSNGSAIPPSPVEDGVLTQRPHHFPRPRESKSPAVSNAKCKKTYLVQNESLLSPPPLMHHLVLTLAAREPPTSTSESVCPEPPRPEAA